MKHSEQIGELATALAAAQAEFDPVAKSGNNTFDHYKYANLGDYMAAANPKLLAKHGLSVVESVEGWERLADHKTQKGGLEYVTRVSMAIRLLHTSGQWIEIESQGEGMDRADKSAYKAITGARKYGIACLLRLVTTDDAELAERKEDAHMEERTHGTPTRPQPPQRTSAPAGNAAPMKTMRDSSGLLVPLTDRTCEHEWQERNSKNGKYFVCAKCRNGQITLPQIKKIQATMGDLHLTDDHATAIKHAMGVESGKDLCKGEASALIDWLDALANGAAIPDDDGPPAGADRLNLPEGDSYPF